MKPCDNTSVGVLIQNDVGETLLIERARPPYGIAPPAGHQDGLAPRIAAETEVFEETGLSVVRLRALCAGRKNNACRRGATWHHWTVFSADVTGQTQANPDEVRNLFWFCQDTLDRLADRTRAHLRREINDIEWRLSPGLEPVWLEWFTDLGVIS